MQSVLTLIICAICLDLDHWRNLSWPWSFVQSVLTLIIRAICLDLDHLRNLPWPWSFAQSVLTFILKVFFLLTCLILAEPRRRPTTPGSCPTWAKLSVTWMSRTRNTRMDEDHLSGSRSRGLSSIRFYRPQSRLSIKCGHSMCKKMLPFFCAKKCCHSSVQKMLPFCCVQKLLPFYCAKMLQFCCAKNVAMPMCKFFYHSSVCKKCCHFYVCKKCCYSAAQKMLPFCCTKIGAILLYIQTVSGLRAVETFALFFGSLILNPTYPAMEDKNQNTFYVIFFSIYSSF